MADDNAPLPDAVSENIETVAEFYARHEERKSRSQLWIERFSLLVGSPGYVGGSVLFIAGWIVYNLLAPGLDLPQPDPPPFAWLQGLVALNAFIISTTVLIRQNYAARLAEHHAHLDLQVNLLTEKKSSTIIRLLEELRRDLPNVRNTQDPEADALARPTDPKAVLSAIERERGT
ncbi:MAG TPA: DUF1003 domain-containing protein [Telluria sp.]|nr:DUF1003 domain-containing protein [Telluria sp.]